MPERMILFTIACTMSAAAQTSTSPPASTSTQSATAPDTPSSPASKRMRKEAAGLLPLMRTDLGREFLAAADNLPEIEPRTIYRDKVSRLWHSESGMRARMEADPLLEFEPAPVSEDRYYDTKYGSPIAYARLFDLLGKTGRTSFMSTRVLDFGYGTIGHLRMLASCGSDVTGLDVDTFLTALYSEPSDTGLIATPTGEQGRITLINGRLSDVSVVTRVGDGYDLIISKNTLKRGYIHPPPGIEVDSRMLIDLGLEDEAFLKALFDALKPGGHVMIYNICPKQNNLEKGEQFIPWADGRCPFEADLITRTGFRILAMDRDDSAVCREMAAVLGWDKGQGAMNLAEDLFAHFTILEKPVP